MIYHILPDFGNPNHVFTIGIAVFMKAGLFFGPYRDNQQAGRKLALTRRQRNRPEFLINPPPVGHSVY
jgi:hypothetical protein